MRAPLIFVVLAACGPVSGTMDSGSADAGRRDAGVGEPFDAGPGTPCLDWAMAVPDCGDAGLSSRVESCTRMEQALPAACLAYAAGNRSCEVQNHYTCDREMPQVCFLQECAAYTCEACQGCKVSCSGQTCQMENGTVVYCG